MAEIDIVLGIVGSASALYGFTVAYYVFARGLEIKNGPESGNRTGSDVSQPPRTRPTPTCVRSSGDARL